MQVRHSFFLFILCIVCHINAEEVVCNFVLSILGNGKPEKSKIVSAIDLDAAERSKTNSHEVRH